jgi:hypothetical protein
MMFIGIGFGSDSIDRPIRNSELPKSELVSAQLKSRMHSQQRVHPFFVNDFAYECSSCMADGDRVYRVDREFVLQSADFGADESIV